MSPWVFLAFVACGGGDEPAPPSLAQTSPSPSPSITPPPESVGQVLREKSLKYKDYETQLEASRKMLQDLLKHLDDIQNGICQDAQKKAAAALFARSIGVEVQVPPIPSDCLNKFNNAVWIWSRLTDAEGNPIANKPADREWFERKIARIINKIGGDPSLRALASAGGLPTDDQRLLMAVGPELSRYFRDQVGPLGYGPQIRAAFDAYAVPLGW